jgi:hypothetical protein
VINTNPATLRSGTVWFQIDTTNISNTDLLDMSDLSFEFDLKSAEAVINSLGVISGAMSITVDDRTTANGVYDTLLAEIGASTATYISNVPATMYFQKHGATSAARFPFQVTLQGVEYDVVNNKTQIQLLPPVWRSTNCNVHFDNMPANYPQRWLVNEVSPGVTTAQFEAYYMGDIVEAYIATLDNGTGNQNIYRSGYDGATASTNYFPEPGFGRSVDYNVGGNVAYYVGNTVYGFADTHLRNGGGGNDSILSKVISVAGMEGAVFGSAFSVNFYMNRRNNKENITIGNSDMSDMKIVRGSQQINAINVRIRPNQISPSGYYPTFDTANEQVEGSVLGSQFFGLELIAHRPQFSRGVLKDDVQIPPVSPPQYINSLLASTGSAGKWNTNNVALGGATAYLGAFDLSAQTSERIETTILGVDKVKPYQVLRFGSDTPARLQNKHFRPTSIKYNFKDDTIKITAYKIP